MIAFYSLHPWENHFRLLSLRCSLYLPKFYSEKAACKDLPDSNNLGALITSNWYINFDLICGERQGIVEGCAHASFCWCLQVQYHCTGSIYFPGTNPFTQAPISLSVKWSSVLVVLNSYHHHHMTLPPHDIRQADIHNCPLLTNSMVTPNPPSPCQQHLLSGLGPLLPNWSLLPLNLLESILHIGATRGLHNLHSPHFSDLNSFFLVFHSLHSTQPVLLALPQTCLGQPHIRALALVIPSEKSWPRGPHSSLPQFLQVCAQRSPSQQGGHLLTKEDPPSLDTLLQVWTVMLAAQYSLHPSSTLFHSLALITTQASPGWIQTPWKPGCVRFSSLLNP